MPLPTLPQVFPASDVRRTVPPSPEAHALEESTTLTPHSTEVEPLACFTHTYCDLVGAHSIDTRMKETNQSRTMRKDNKFVCMGSLSRS